MAVFKCKMCGGTIEFEPGATVGVCDSCGTKQTLPRLDDDRRTNLYDRANHFRRNNEFDKAAGIYEQILTEDTTDSEAYWSLVLCQYGIEYVEDPTTRKRVPTVNRAQFTSIFDDDNYKSALQYADSSQRLLYEEEANTINEIQKGILAISQKEDPFDVFICYKETDNNGRRTQDSVLATDLYHQLTQEGFKVFFSRITLEDKLGTAYEPYIFAALNSAKVMVVLGTKQEHFNAVWVKNEWSRYLALVKKSGGKKVLIPAYRDMDPYDLPEEFSHLQALDMSKLGFMQDLIRGIKKLMAPLQDIQKLVSVNTGGTDILALKKRIDVFLENGEFSSAIEYCDKVLDHLPEDSDTYIRRLCAEVGVKRSEDLKDAPKAFDQLGSYRNAIRFGTESVKEELWQASSAVSRRLKGKKKRKMVIAAIISAVIFVVLIISMIVTRDLLDKAQEEAHEKRISEMLEVAEQYADEGDFQGAYDHLYEMEIANERNPDLVEYILAGIEYENENYQEAYDLFSEKYDEEYTYKNARSYAQKSRYRLLVDCVNDDLSLGEVEKNLAILEDLVDEGIRDTEGLNDKLAILKYERQIDYYYERKLYHSFKTDLYSFMNEFPQEANAYRIKRQKKWYDDAVSDVKRWLAEESYYSRDVGKWLSSYMYCIFEICGEYENSEYYCRFCEACDSKSISALTESLSVIPEIKDKIWDFIFNPGWLYNTKWKTADGKYYFR